DVLFGFEPLGDGVDGIRQWRWNWLSFAHVLRVVQPRCCSANHPSGRPAPTTPRLRLTSVEACLQANKFAGFTGLSQALRRRPSSHMFLDNQPLAAVTALRAMTFTRCARYSAVPCRS